MDTLLAILHHLGVFALAIIIAFQLALVRPGVTAADLRRVALIDLGYGLTALAVVVIGLVRIRYGGKGLEYYQENAWFWAKMATFALVGLISVAPTVAFRRWAKRLRLSEQSLPLPHELAFVRKLVIAETALFLLIPVFAAVMARHQG